MGFGYLVVGYVVTYLMSINSFSFMFVPVGTVIILIGADELRRYNKMFSWLIPVGLTQLLVSVYQFCAGLEEKWGLYIPFVYDTVSTVLSWVSEALMLGINVLILLSIRSIAGQVGLKDKQSKAIRNLVLVCLYYILDFLSIFGAFPEAASKYVLFAELILFLAWLLLNIVLIYSCYMRICPQGQENMPWKKSRFAFINQLHERADREEKETMERTQAYIEKKRNRHNSKNSKKR